MRTPLRAWAAGARVRTLPASAVPVLVGTAAAASVADGDGVVWWRAAAAMAVGLAMQTGVNYANDYSDGIRGADAGRVGPTRLVASGAARPAAVRRAAYLSFLLAAVAGLALAAAVAWWLVAVGAACIAAAWYYTGGRRPYGYRGWGEVSVFVFFGLVATAGSAFVQDGRLTALPLGAAVPVGLAAVALLVANNLRDRPGDAESGKRTLAVLMGDRGTRVLYVALTAALFVSLPYLALVRPWALLALAALPLAVMPVRAVLLGRSGRDLIPVLAGTARLQLGFGVALTVGLALGA